MFFVAISRHHVSTCSCTCYRSCSLLLCLGIMFPMYMSFLLGRKICSLCEVSRHHVSHVHVIDLSYSAGRHVICCCVSASCFPCTCYRSFFLGRKTCSFLSRQRKTCSFFMFLGFFLW